MRTSRCPGIRRVNFPHKPAWIPWDPGFGSAFNANSGLSLEHLCAEMCVSEVIYLNICTPYLPTHHPAAPEVFRPASLHPEFSEPRTGVMFCLRFFVSSWCTGMLFFPPRLLCLICRFAYMAVRFWLVLPTLDGSLEHGMSFSSQDVCAEQTPSSILVRHWQ